MALAADLRRENDELVALCRGLLPALWSQPTGFKAWTPWDVVAHLCCSDTLALAACQGEAAFAQAAEAVREHLAAGRDQRAMGRVELGHLDPRALLQHWETVFDALVAALARLEPKDRLPWFGPAMGARSFATARLMETWAHGQAVWDLLHLRRPLTDRLRHIAHLGVGTYGWSFSNRLLTVPQPVPFVQLQAPDGSTWTWNAPSSTDVVQGPAEDFCRVVTQCRHVQDTRLMHAGTGSAWMQVAQCFAGPPCDAPAPGQRVDPG